MLYKIIFNSKFGLILEKSLFLYNWLSFCWMLWHYTNTLCPIRDFSKNPYKSRYSWVLHSQHMVWLHLQISRKNNGRNLLHPVWSYENYLYKPSAKYSYFYQTGTPWTLLSFKTKKIRHLSHWISHFKALAQLNEWYSLVCPITNIPINIQNATCQCVLPNALPALSTSIKNVSCSNSLTSKYLWMTQKDMSSIV